MRVVLLSMAYRSGMGRVASALASASVELGQTALIAPVMDDEPVGVPRVWFPRPSSGGSKVTKVTELLKYNLRAAWAVWKSVDRQSIFVMVDLFSTVPLSILPVLAARVRGAKTVLNLHDFYPHSLRYPERLQWLERWFFRSAYRMFDLIATTTHAQSARLVKEARYPKGRIVEISLGAFPTAGIKHRTAGEPVRFLVLGAIRRNKHVLTSIQALANVRKDCDVIIRVAGAPRPEERDYWNECDGLLRLIDKAEVSAFFVPDEDMPEILSGVSAILCSYENFDSASAVSLVAVTNRIPLIATICAVPEELRGVEGAWWPIETPVSEQAVERAVRAFLMLDKEAQGAMAEKAYRTFTQQDHWSDAIAAIRMAFSG